jgi:hypothetical protein
MTKRRDFIMGSLLGLGALATGGTFQAFAAPDGRLIDAMRRLCDRLAPLGWRQLLLEVTDHALDIGAADLAAELAKPLTKINRAYPGFGDFSTTGNRAIEPGLPDYSLLYHALASPSVTANSAHVELGGFPTLAELDTVENYIYAARNATLGAVKEQVVKSLPGRAPKDGFAWAVAIFALNYRNTAASVGGRHAQLCFSRTGIGRIGDLDPFYDAKLRGFVGEDPAKPFSFRVMPRRFAAFLAIRVKGIDRRTYGPQDPFDADEARHFWLPVHKLFAGDECLKGLNLSVEYESGLRNDELASFHRFLEQQGLRNNTSGEALQEFPFVIKDDQIASLSKAENFGPGVLVPRAAPLIDEAKYRDGQLVTYPVDHAFTGDPTNLQMSSPFVLAGHNPLTEPNYFGDAEQDKARTAPEYINARHRVSGAGVDNLNKRSDMMRLLSLGNYEALHYIDFSGDGWVKAKCRQLREAGVVNEQSAFCMVGLPDFLPNLSQRDLMHWWRKDVPEPLREALWATPPYALSQTRFAANVELPAEAGFQIEDDTVTAIVAQPAGADRESVEAPVQETNGTIVTRKVGLPDGSPGVFDPGWDTSIGTRFTDGPPPDDFDPDRDTSTGTRFTGGPVKRLHRYLVGHGLGSPFIEDAKLCAALGAYWPGVAPDATREYQPDKILSGGSYPWPSIVPLTDIELGMVDGPDGKRMSWDGVPGPTEKTIGAEKYVAYRDETFVDYIDILGTMTAALTARIEADDYKARTLALAALYWSLGIRPLDPDKVEAPETKDSVNEQLRKKASWAVLSFRNVANGDRGLADAAQTTKMSLEKGRRWYFIRIYKWGEQLPDPDDFRTVLVRMKEDVNAYSDGRVVLFQRNGKWSADTSIPK